MDPYGHIDRKTFLQMSPPRRVPANIRKVAIPGGAIWGGLFFGLFFMAAGLAASWFFVPKNILNQWKLERESSALTTGTITAVEATNLTIGPDRVYAGHFRYRPEGGPDLKGKAFITGNRWTPDSEVRVRYLAENPTLAIPEGGRLDGFTGFTLFVLLFPTIGAAMVLGAFLRQNAKVRILRHGISTIGRVKSMEASMVRINEQPMSRFKVIREDDMREFTIRSHAPHEVAFLQGKMSGEEALGILYDPNHPKRMLFPELWNV